MTDQKMSKNYWNIFARELEDILAAHHLQMDALVDLAGVSPEKVQYLTASLHTPQALPVLTREEMRELEQKLPLNKEESLRLSAGLLATSIQRTFMDRVDLGDAFYLAEQAFPTILDALQARAQGSVIHEETRWGASKPVADDEFDAFFEPTLRMLNDAEMELQLSYNVGLHTTRVAKALSARAYFEQVFAELERADKQIRASRLWRDSYTTSQRGMKNARKRLEDLGV